MVTLRRFLVLFSALLLLPLLAVSTASSTASAARDSGLFQPLDGFKQGRSDHVRVRPTAFTAYRVDLAGLRDRLAGGGQQTLEVPDPTGELATFTVAEDSVMEPSLQAAHPETRTYAGHGADGSTIRLDVTPLGFHAFVRRADGRAWYVDPAEDRAGEDRVLSYFGSAMPRASQPFVERDLKRATQAALAGGPEEFSTPGGIVSTRTYRLAFVTDPTYGTYFGGTNVLVMAAKTTLINRVNEVYNDDLAIKFVMVAGTDTLLNLNEAEATAPNGPCGANACYDHDAFYPDGSAGDTPDGCTGALLDRNEFALGQIIGAENFDIGHIGLGVNGGGIAGLGVVGGPFKADGCTGLAKPDGDFYAIDYVAHEIGHQMGGNHTFNGTQANCSAGNRNTTPFSTQVEPGSGSSIMAYAGICASDNLQPHSDPYFSFTSIDEINATTAAAPGGGDEQQVVNLSDFDGVDAFTISCAGCPATSDPVVNGVLTYNKVTVAAAVSDATGETVTAAEITDYDSGGFPDPSAPSANGFTVDFTLAAAGQPVPTLVITPTAGTFTTFTGTIYNGGPTTNQGTVAATANRSPVVIAPAAKAIPIRTPFTLTGSATDADGHTLTYLWEQTDPGGPVGTGLVDNNKTDGPLFRQFGVSAQVSADDTLLYHSPGENLAGTSPSRTFPDLAQVVAGNTNATTGSCPTPLAAGSVPVTDPALNCFSEFLPTGAWLGNPATPRVLHFRLSARDEFTPDAAADHAGGLSSANVALTLTPTAGPFLVTSHASSGAASGVETVKWDVAGTNTAALAQNVKISLSTDGGLTFPTVLVASTPNDGSEAVLLPAVTTTTARIKVEAVGNYFFDVNDANFSIGSVSPGIHVALGKGKFISPKGSSTKHEDAKGKAKFEFLGESGPSPSGSATFTFKKGKIAFTGDTVKKSKIKGNKFKTKLTGANRGKAGYTLVIVALDKGSKDKIRIRLLKGKRLVYDSMPGKRPSAKPKTRIKGTITIT